MPLHRGMKVLLIGGFCALYACSPGDQGNETVSDTSAVAAPAGGTDSLSIAGFQTPESVLYDEAGDVYLVSNINGDPFGKDDNGFISRVSPDGTVQLKWVDGAAAEVTLNAPKGLAIIGDTLYVADIDSIRAFSRTSGAPLGAIGISGVSFLNDLAAGGGALYVSDTGVKTGFAPAGTDAVYRVVGGKANVVLRDTALHGPNGLAFTPNGILVVPYGSKEIMSLPGSGGKPTVVATLPAGMMDGVVRLNDGSLLVSSWESRTVYLVNSQGQAQPVLQNIESPADIGYDSRRNRLLVPVFNGNRLEVRALPR
jgi:hypothetical protein